MPANGVVAFPVGTELKIVNGNGAGAITIAITTDTMRWANDGSAGSRTLAANGVAKILKVTATEWVISGVWFNVILAVAGSLTAPRCHQRKGPRYLLPRPFFLRYKRAKYR